LYGKQGGVLKVIVKALQKIDGSPWADRNNVFITYYDKDGNIIGGDRRTVGYMSFGIYENEIITVSFTGSEMPTGTNSYKLWLKKPPSEAIQAQLPTKNATIKMKSKKKPSPKKQNQVIQFVPIEKSSK